MAIYKKAFGVYQDGDELRIATVVLDGDKISLDNLYKEHLAGGKRDEEDALRRQFASPFEEAAPEYHDGAYRGDEYANTPPPPPKDDDTNVEFEELDIDESYGQAPTQETSHTQDTLTTAALAVQMAGGLVCANLDVSNVAYRRVSLPPKTPEKKIQAEVRKAFFNPDQVTMSAYSWFPSGEQDEVIGIRHEGSMDLLENLVAVNQNSFNSMFDFALVQPNEVALINAVRYNNELFADDITAIFYIGVDFSRVTLMRGDKFLLELPIINEGYSSDNILNTVYSRFLLEKAHHDIPSLNRIFLAGSNLHESTLELLREKEPDANVQFLLPRRLMENVEESAEYSPEELAEYIVPIMLAVAGLQPREKLLYEPNFLPRQIRKQKTFALGFSGVLVLAVVITVALMGLQGIFKQRSAMRQLQGDIQELEQRISVNQIVIDQITAMEQEIVQHENNLARVKQLIGDHNTWHYIIEESSNCFILNYLSWSTNLHKEDPTQFRLKGSTTQRTNIVAFSQLFPRGQIEKVMENEIEGYTIWDYEITFGMPDPLQTKQLDYKREGIRTTPPKLAQPDSKSSAPEATEEDTPAPAPATPPRQQASRPAASRQQAQEQQPAPAQQQRQATQPAQQKPAAQPAPQQPQAQKPAPTPQQPQQTSSKPETQRVTGPEEYDQALKSYFAGNVDKAIEQFGAYIQSHNDAWVTNATYFMGECYYRKANFTKAAELFEKVLQLGGRKQADALMMLGNTWQKLGNNQKAVDYWNRLTVDYSKSQYVELAKRKISEASE